MLKKAVVVSLTIIIGIVLGKVIVEAACGDNGEYTQAAPDVLSICYDSPVTGHNQVDKTVHWKITYGDGVIRKNLSIRSWGDCYLPTFILTCSPK